MQGHHGLSLSLAPCWFKRPLFCDDVSDATFGNLGLVCDCRPALRYVVSFGVSWWVLWSCVLAVKSGSEVKVGGLVSGSGRGYLVVVLGDFWWSEWLLWCQRVVVDAREGEQGLEKLIWSSHEVLWWGPGKRCQFVFSRVYQGLFTEPMVCILGIFIFICTWTCIFSVLEDIGEGTIVSGENVPWLIYLSYLFIFMQYIYILSSCIFDLPPT